MANPNINPADVTAPDSQQPRSRFARAWHWLIGPPPRDHRGRRVRLIFLDPSPLGFFQRRSGLSKEMHAAIRSEHVRRTRTEQVLTTGFIVFTMLSFSLLLLYFVIDPLADTMHVPSLSAGGMFVITLSTLAVTYVAESRLQRRTSATKIDCILQRARCPSCAHNLSGAKPDPTDNSTICPECGAAWRMPTTNQHP